MNEHAFDLKIASQVAPFPREKFLKFISKLKIHSKDYGLVPFRLLGSQTYMLDELCKAKDEGISVGELARRRCEQRVSDEESVLAQLTTLLRKEVNATRASVRRNLDETRTILNELRARRKKASVEEWA